MDELTKWKLKLLLEAIPSICSYHRISRQGSCCKKSEQFINEETGNPEFHNADHCCGRISDCDLAEKFQQ